MPSFSGLQCGGQSPDGAVSRSGFTTTKSAKGHPQTRLFQALAALDMAVLSQLWNVQCMVCVSDFSQRFIEAVGKSAEM